MVDGSGSKSVKDGAVVPCVLPYCDSTLASAASPHGMGGHDPNVGAGSADAVCDSHATTQSCATVISVVHYCTT
jgi:hypothetical protein